MHFKLTVIACSVGPMGVQRVVETLTSTFLRLVEVKPQNPFVVSLDRTGKPR